MSAFQVQSDFVLARHLSFVGFGRISQCLCKGLISAGFKPENILVTDSDKDKLENAVKEFRVNSSEKNSDAGEFAEIVFLCVKPKHALSVLDEISVSLKKNHLLVSVAAGIKLEQIEEIVSCNTARIMPNVGVYCNKGMTGFALSSNVTKTQEETLLSIFRALGNTVKLSEKEFDVFTAVSGSGPGFWAFLVKEMVNSAELLGLSKENSREIVLQCVKGTVSLLSDQGFSEKEVIEMVSSPGGVTEKELSVLQSHSIEKIFFDALEKAVTKSGDLGNDK